MSLAARDFMLFMLCLGLPVLAFGLWQLCREIAPRKWRQVPGTIVSAERTSKTVYVPPGQRRREYLPVIEYEYFVDGRPCRSTQRRISNYVSGTDFDADAVIARYPVGQQVTVFVHPRQPAQAVLEYGTSPLSWILIVLGLIFSTFALMPL